MKNRFEILNRTKNNIIKKILVGSLFLFLITAPNIHGLDISRFDGKISEVNLNSLYTYHNYNSLVSDMQDLEDNYQDIFELTTAQDEFDLPDVISGSETYKTWIMRITNEDLGLNKPEVLLIGGHHGDETVSIEAAYYLAEWLCENYEDDPWMHYLIDNREIYIMPVVNPYGWAHMQRYDENGLDMNRDYPFDESSHVFGTIGARAIHELSKDHLFINTASWHSGTEMIIYAWGSYAHTSNTECPDDVAFYQQGYYMSEYGGPYSGYYPFGRSNDILYPCYGAYEDYAYAMSWDLPNANPSWPTEGCRSLTHCIEMSSVKNPSESTLGGREELYIPGGSEDGFIPKNIRIALLLIDTAEPYVDPSDEIPDYVAEGQPVTFDWEVKGGFTTSETYIQWGSDPDPINDYDYSTSFQSGGTWWDDEVFSEEVMMPTSPGIYYFVISAKVDHDTLVQENPDPDIPAQSLFVNMRTDDSWSISNNGNTLEGKSTYYSEVFQIGVGEDLQNPTTFMEVDGNMGNNGWYNNYAKIIFNAEDDISGVNYTMYRVNGEDWKVYEGPFNPGQGTIEIEYFSVDYAGNEEEPKSGSVRIDYSRPLTTISLSGEEGEPDWYNSTVEISFEAIDSYSGVDQTYYQIDSDNKWYIFTDTIGIDGEGSHLIEYYSVDIAGNKEEDREKEFSIDLTNPTVSINYPSGGETIKDLIDVLWIANDDRAEPGIDLFYQINGGEWEKLGENEENDGIFSWNTSNARDGDAKIKITAKDYAGNIETAISNTFLIDNSEPPLKPDTPAGPSSGRINNEYIFTSRTTDPDGDQIFYLFDWGDETDSGWIGPFDSGDIVEVNHIWKTKGNYDIKVKAKDGYGEESEWSDPLEISMPKIKLNKLIVISFLENHPIIYQMLKKYLQL